ncbi:MAG: hypothetical protein JO351_02150 [Candidatus Eremiobacteraeota bacterium]|nr:hypothetical protein [Candidatus Eremiobacteraeota bacterium]MBV9055424.1 hypothetical protein [Candidatus Eremiobacteraeota bacterium]
MSAARARARRYGLRVVFADLGDWAACELLAEYDARNREIRVNRRVAGSLRGTELRRFVDLAVAHELYHHREAIGEVRRLEKRSEREAAADAFALTVVALQ